MQTYFAQKTLKKGYLAFAVVSGLASGTASPNVWFSETANDLNIETQTGYQIIDDASFLLTMRSAHFHRDSRKRIENSSERVRRRDWSLGGYADFQSGWGWGVIGFDLGLYGQHILSNRGTDFWNSFTRNNDADDTSKLGVANIKMHYDWDNAGVEVRAGRMKVDFLPFFYGDTFAAMPSTYEGVRADGYWNNVSGYAARFTGHSYYKNAGMSNIANPDGENANLDALGVRWQDAWSGGLSLAIDYAEQPDYLRKLNYEAQYGLAIDGGLLLLTGNVLTQKAGNTYEKPNHDARLVYGEAFWSKGRLNSYAGFSYAGDTPFDTYFTDDIFAGTVRTIGLWNDFNQKDMKSMVVGGDYNLAEYDLPRWTVFFNGIYGWGADTNSPVYGYLLPISKSHAYEAATGFTYEVFDGPVQGLWLNTTWIRDGGGYNNHDGIRILLDYTIKVM